MMFSSTVGVKIMFGVDLYVGSGYAHVFILLFVVVVTLPQPPDWLVDVAYR